MQLNSGLRQNIFGTLLPAIVALLGVSMVISIWFDAQNGQVSAFRFSSTTVALIRLILVAILFAIPSALRSMSLSKQFFWILIVGSFVWMLSTKWTQHLSMNTHSHDLGLFHSVLWNGAHGNGWIDAFKQQLYFSDHLIFFLTVLTPFYFVHAGVETLFWLSGAAYAAAGIALIKLSEFRSKDRLLAMIIGIAFLTNRYVWNAFLHEFHPDFFAPLFIFLLFLSVYRQNKLLFTLSLLVVLSIKEDYTLYLIPIGVYFILHRETRMQGFWLAVLGVLYGLLAFLVLVPYFYGTVGLKGNYQYLGSWGHLGNGFTEIAVNILRNPMSLVQNISVRTLVSFGGKCLFLPLLSPLTLIYILPPLILNTTSSFPLIRQLSIHYGLIPMTLTYVGCMEALRYVKNKGFERLAIFLACGLFIIGIGRYWIYWPQPEAALLAKQRNQLNITKPMCVQSSLFPHLIPEGQFSIFPECADEAQYLLLHPAASTYPLSQEDYRSVTDDLRAGSHWVLRKKFNRAYLFERA